MSDAPSKYADIIDLPHHAVSYTHLDVYKRQQLVIQGYNFGADGWFAWCKQRNVHAYTVELAREYSETKMPADAKGTPTHAQKWLTAYDAIHGSHRS